MIWAVLTSLWALSLACAAVTSRQSWYGLKDHYWDLAAIGGVGALVSAYVCLAYTFDLLLALVGRDGTLFLLRALPLVAAP